MNIIRFLTLFWILGSSTLGFAQTIPLSNINQGDFDKVVSNFSANFWHTSVSGASPLGHIFGFEFGAVGGVTNTPDLNSLAQRTNPAAKAGQLPNGELVGAITVPLGLTVEAGLIPKVGSSDFKFSSLSLGLKWTPTELLFDMPLSLAVKGQVTKTSLEYSQPIQGVATSYKYDSTVTGLTLLASKDFMLVEPYVGIGVVHGKGELNATGSGMVFNSAFTASQSASSTRSSGVFIAGAELKLFVLKVGAEYSRLYGDNRYNGKLSFYF